MKISVRYFAVLRERTGLESEVVELPDGSSVGAAIDHIASQHDAVLALRASFRAAVNQTMVNDDHILADCDELALIPPVAGGQDLPRARVIDAPLSLDRVVGLVRSPRRGGLVTFTGQVRRQSHGRDVEHLEYEAYVEMAERVLDELCTELEAEFEDCRIAVEHRIGHLDVGEDAVVIAAAAPHRDEAFRACRAMIDRLKERVPIWKKEVSPDGSEWVGLGP